MEAKVDAVHVLAAERRIHQQRRKRMCHRVADNAVDARGSIDAVDAVGVAQHLGRNLAGRSLFASHGRRKRKNAARADAQHAADNPLLAHTKPDQRMPVALLLQELHHHDVVVQGGRCANNFVEIGL